METSFHYITLVLCGWGWQDQKCNSKCPIDIDTDWAIPEKFLGFYPWIFHKVSQFLGSAKNQGLY